MNRFFGFALLLALFSIPAFAAKDSQSLTLSIPVKVGATQLPAGSYTVAWTGTGQNVQVTLSKDKKTLVTVPAKLVPEKNGHVGVSTDTVAGVDVLESIQFDKLSLVLAGTPAAGE